MGNTMISIYVGEDDDTQIFAVHEHILCAKIPYFKERIAIKPNEGRIGFTKFPNYSPQAFDLLLSWVYDGHLRKLTTVTDEEDGTTSASWHTVELHRLAQKVGLPELMDTVMDAHRRFDRENNVLPDLGFVENGYEITSPSSPFRRYLAHTCAYRIFAEGDKTMELDSLSRLMVAIPRLNLDVLQALKESRGNVVSPKDMPDCDFHSHDKGVPCPWKDGRS
jgi:hypothetical protein